MLRATSRSFFRVQEHARDGAPLRVANGNSDALPRTPVSQGCELMPVNNSLDEPNLSAEAPGTF
jgi:hypothetical protein